MMPAMSETSNRAMPSGWYPDPADSSRLRKWDGDAWTDSWMIAPSGPGQAAAGSPAGSVLPAAAAPPGSGAQVGVPGWHLDPYAPTTRRERFWDGADWAPRLRFGSVFPGRTPLGSGFFTLAAWVRGLLYVQVAVAAVGAVVAVWTVSVLNRWMRAPDTITLDEANRVDTGELVVALPSFLLYLATGVLFLVWLSKAYAGNRVDPTKLHHSRGWAVGSWFVPFLNLFRPYQVVRDLRDGIRSAMGATGPDRKRWLVRTWWAAFLTMTAFDVVGRSVDRATESATGLDLLSSMRTLSWLTFGSSLATAVAAVLAALVVSRLTAGLRPVEYAEPVG